eukprot:g941.t1
MASCGGAKQLSVDTFARIRPSRAGQPCLERKVTRVKPNGARSKSKKAAGQQSLPSHDALELMLGDNPASIEMKSRRTSSRDHFRFGFRRVLGPDSGQEALFKLVCSDMIEAALDGYNGTIFAYGQTGSGKTYTMTGGEHYHERGLIPRAISAVFDAFEQRRAEHSYACFISYLEIYNESIYDLLDRSHRHKPLEQWTRIQVLNDECGALHMRQLRVYEACTEEDALSLLFLGNVNRITSDTAMNQASSRSHCLFTLTIEGRAPLASPSTAHGTSGRGGEGGVTTSKLHLVDLAGSERIYKRQASSGAGAVSKRRTLKEGKHINLSLHHLEQVVMALRGRGGAGTGPSASAAPHGAAGPHPHVPYRNSMLTLVLRDSLGGNCRTRFILTLNPEIEFFDETVSTCRFAQRCAELSTTVQANKTSDLKLLVQRLQREREELMATLEREREERARSGSSAMPSKDADAEGTMECGASVGDGNRNAASLLDDANTRRAALSRPLNEQEQAFCRRTVELFMASAVADAEGDIDTDPMASAAEVFRELGDIRLAVECCALLRADAVFAASAAHDARSEVERERERAQKLESQLAKDRLEQQRLEHQLHQQKQTAVEERQRLEAELSARAPPSESSECRSRGTGCGDMDAIECGADGNRTIYAERIGPNGDGSVSEEKLIQVLQVGATLVKHGRRGQPKSRFVSLSKDRRRIQWRKAGEASVRGFVSVASLCDVRAGNYSRTFHRTMRGKVVDPDTAFVLACTDRTLDLQVDVSDDPKQNKELRDTWVQACSMLLRRNDVYSGSKSASENLQNAGGTQQGGGIALTQL